MSTNSFANFGKIDFMKAAPIMLAIAATAFVLSLVLIFTKGFKLGIDFEGGIEIQAKFAVTPDISKIRNIVDSVGAEGSSVQSFGDGHEVLIRMQQAQAATSIEVNKLNKERVSKVTAALKAEAALPEEGILKVDSVGPQVGAELKTQAALSVLYSLLAILVYVGLRFDFRYAPGAVIALINNTIIMLGIYSILGREINIQVLAGILTLIGYSINDTMVVYDSIRGTEPLYKERGFPFVVNKSINDILVRTLLTGVTTLMVCTCLYVFGSSVLQDIAFTLLIGVPLGTLTSIYVASPLIPVTDKLVRRFI